MSTPRPVILEFKEVCENLMKLNDLTYEEMDAVQQMLERIEDMLDSQ